VVITHSLLGYFMPVREVLAAMTGSPARHPVAFVFALVATGIVFVNFTWFREQTCIVVCPYGRLQAALYDPDTVVVGYDRRRGEPRGVAGSDGAGDCVDCFRCVAVCPTGIDIRNGTQMECVGCANCIDACDAVMAKLGRPRGLVRYDSQRGFETATRRFVRARLWLYLVLLAAGVIAFTLATRRHAPFEANLLRNAGSAFTIEGERVRNTFRLHVYNKLPAASEFRITVVPTAGFEVVVAQPSVTLDSLQDAHVAVHVAVAKADFRPGLAVAVDVRTTAADGAELTQRATAPLAGPVAR
jgi:cytochrome c oxidase accessory protein FixG